MKLIGKRGNGYREKEIELAKAVGVMFGNLALVIETFEFAGIYVEFNMGNKTVQPLEFFRPDLD